MPVRGVLPRVAVLLLAVAACSTAGSRVTEASGAVTLTVDTSVSGAVVPATAIGLNTAVWDNLLTGKKVSGLIRQAGVKVLRYPGGSTSDVYHWQEDTLTAGVAETIPGGTSFAQFMSKVAQPSHTMPIITVNYGSNADGTGGGDPQEAAAWVRYANVQHNDDVQYWEIGNEIYGNGYYGASWETDMHASHSPAEYGQNAVTFIRAMKSVDPTIKVGVVLTAPTQWPDGLGPEVWNPTVLKATCADADFVSIHWYPQNPGHENDASLLASVDTIPGMVHTLRSLLAQYCGARAASMGIMVTETNSVSSNPGKQTTGPVNALFLVENYLNWMASGVQNVTWWTLHNGATYRSNHSKSLAGRYTYGDYGVLASGDAGLAVNSPFPTYGALTLVGKALQPGATFVPVHSTSPSIVAFGLRAADGSLSIVAVNRSKSATTPLVVKGVRPTLSGAHVWSFDAAHPKLAKSTLHSSHYMLPGYGAVLIRLSAATSNSHNR